MVDTADWAWEGGRPCLDFVNTIRGRVQQPLDTIASEAQLGQWLHQAGLLSTAGPASGLLESARHLRQALESLFATVPPAARVADRSPDPAGPGHQVPESALEVVNSWAVRAPGPVLRSTPDGVLVQRPAPDGAEQALAVIAADAVALVADGGLARVKTCAHDGCGLQFEDTTRRRDRKWCAMARCGNRVKARRHAQRRVRTASGPGRGGGPHGGTPG